MLRACHRSLRPGGRLAFYTIFITAGLSDSDYRRAARAGPPAVRARRADHTDMLLAAGFADVQETDLTAEFLRTARARYQGRQQHFAQLAAAEGEASVNQKQADSRAQIKAIEAGLLRRSLFLARRP